MIGKSQTQALRQSIKIHWVPERLDFSWNKGNNVTMIEEYEPSSYDKILKSSESESWLKAMKFEIGSMYENQV